VVYGEFLVGKVTGNFVDGEAGGMGMSGVGMGGMNGVMGGGMNAPS
jgi:hypothetical protein